MKPCIRVLTTILILAAASARAQVGSEAAEELPVWLRGKTLEPTYSGGVALIFDNRCNTCHQPGNVAPMPFLSFNEIRQWEVNSNTPMEVLVRSREMPPWPADTSVGEFSNNQLLTDTETDLLIKWVEEGMPRGAGTYESTIERFDGWTIGKPDAIFDLPEYTVGENVEGEVKEFIVETNFPEDRWVVAAEARPGDRYFVMGIEGGPLGSYHTGNPHRVFGQGRGMLLKAGQKVSVKVHYMKMKGYEETDRGTRLGVIFAKDDAPRADVGQVVAEPSPFKLAAGQAGLSVIATHEFADDARVVSLTPILFQRGKSVRAEAILPDGSRQALLSIPRWNPMWQYSYELKTPLAAPRGTVIEVTAEFDNSAENIMNPDPSVEVDSGPAGEMFRATIGVLRGGD